MIHYTDILYEIHSRNRQRTEFLAKFKARQYTPLSPKPCVLCSKSVVHNHYKSGTTHLCTICYNEQTAIVKAFEEILSKFSREND